MDDDLSPLPGKCVVLAPGIRRILAPNPSAMTLHGTNTYILGSGSVAVIDPGPALYAHLDAIMAALDPAERISHILVTHAHLDHSGLCARLARKTGAPVYAYGTAQSGRSKAMQRLPMSAEIGGGEGLDHGFAPDVLLSDGASIAGDSWAVEAIHTPGHLGGHLCFASDGILFSGDHVMGWSTSLVSPPDGDMTDYMASLDRLARRRWDLLLPAHGAPVPDPAKRIAELIAHRRAREAALMAAIVAGASDIATLTRVVYPDIPPTLRPAAARNTLAHLIDLNERNMVVASPFISADATFSLR